MEESKKCGRCKQSLPVDMFAKYARSPDNLQSYCRPCMAQYREDNKERIEANRAAHLLSKPFLRPLRAARTRAEEQGVPFDIDEQYLEDIWTGTCPVYHTRLSLPGQSDLASAGFSTTQSSLDRIIPHKGYVKGNVVWLSNKANMIKQQATAADLQAVATWLHQTEKEIAQHEAD